MSVYKLSNITQHLATIYIVATVGINWDYFLFNLCLLLKTNKYSIQTKR